MPPLRIDHLAITTDPEAETIEVRVTLHAPATGYELEAEALADPESEDGGRRSSGSHGAGGAAAPAPAHPRRPSRGRRKIPHLYGLRVRLLRRGPGAGRGDLVRRPAPASPCEDGRFLLNGRPLYLLMALDQGYWPEGLYTAPSDEALRADVEWAKRFGFNGVRKHQKVEDPRWLYWCDRLGLLVWEEMPNARAWSAEAEELLLAEWERAVVRDANHPCVVAWVPVNESMGFPDLEAGHPGQYAFLERVVALTRRLDPHRPVIDNDGWEHTDVTDVVAIHDYTPSWRRAAVALPGDAAGRPLPPTVWWRDKPLFLPGARYRGQPVMLTEVGGLPAAPLRRPGVLNGRPRGVDRLFDVYAAVAGGTSCSRATLTCWPAWPICPSWPASATPSSTTCSRR